MTARLTSLSRTTTAPCGCRNWQGPEALAHGEAESLKTNRFSIGSRVAVIRRGQEAGRGA
jgi:hypothetical protein